MIHSFQRSLENTCSSWQQQEPFLQPAFSFLVSKHIEQQQSVAAQITNMYSSKIWWNVCMYASLNRGNWWLELCRRWISSGRCLVVQLACWSCCGFHDWCWSGFGESCKIRSPECCHHWKVSNSS
jgi:hypothetical protein